MKKLFILFVAGLSLPNLSAQNVTDAVRYTQQNITGTARYNALGGAFGALGGDFSAINNNPAGSAVFVESAFSFSGTFDAQDNQTYYFNGITSVEELDLNINQLGGVLVLNNKDEGSGFRKISFAFNYDRVANYNDSFVASGISGTSIDRFFLGEAQGKLLGDIRTLDGESIDDAYQNIGQELGYSTQQAFLGFQGFIIEPAEDEENNTAYVSNINAGTFDQEYSAITSGYIGKASFNAATQYGDKLYLGLNLNSHILDYRRRTMLFEDNNNTGSPVSSLRFENTLDALGAGFSFQVGAILKATENFRLGATYDSPTWLTIEEETTQSLVTDGTNGVQNISPNVINVYEDYTLRSPAKVTGSLAYVFGRNGFLSFDYSFQDFSNIEFKSNTIANFDFQNNNIDQQLQAVSTYRLGGEYRAGKWSYRAGYRFQGSPYEDGFVLGDLNGYSVGLGYDFGPTRLDVAYSRSSQERNPALYEGGFTNTAFIDNVNTDVVATLTFRL